jgi:hypothetical protein
MTKRLRKSPPAKPPATAGKQQANAGQWKPGQSGNPAGPKVGSRHPITRMLQQMVDDDGPAVIRKAISMAKEGDTIALKLVLERLLPPVKARTVELELPPIEGAVDVHAALQSVTKAVASGAISPEEGASIAALIGQHRTTLEVAELANQLAALEALVGRKR